jgi:hypothetical protein
MSEKIVDISSSGIIRETNARIDGHVYKVRRMGGGDQLDIQTKTSKIGIISKKAFNLRSKLKALDDEAKDTEALKLVDEVNKVMAELAVVNGELKRCYIKLFDDGTDKQKHTEALFDKYGLDGIRELYDRIPFSKNPLVESDA